MKQGVITKNTDILLATSTKHDVQTAHNMKKLLQNKKANFNYDILDKYLAGLSLLGLEVKSLKNSHGSIAESYIIERGGELFLVGAHIPPYQPGNTPENYDPYRPRKLIITRNEINEIKKKLNEQGLTMVPIVILLEKNLLKIELGIARGKKKHDKRSTLKKRAVDRDIERELKRRSR